MKPHKGIRIRRSITGTLTIFWCIINGVEYRADNVYDLRKKIDGVMQ